MNKLLLLLLVCVSMTSCVTVPAGQKSGAKELIITSSNGTAICQYYVFEYDGHEYITNYRESFLLHSSSCPCHDGE